jgi:hypothetical protein
MSKPMLQSRVMQLGRLLHHRPNPNFGILIKSLDQKNVDDDDDLRVS